MFPIFLKYPKFKNPFSGLRQDLCPIHRIKPTGMQSLDGFGKGNAKASITLKEWNMVIWQIPSHPI
jgi:hypothetical protein